MSAHSRAMEAEERAAYESYRAARAEQERDAARALAARLADALKDDAEYFDNRADADNIGDPPVSQGNAEMYRLMDVERALAEYDAARREWGK